MSVHFDNAATRATIEAFLDAASARIDRHPKSMVFDITQGRLVIGWMRALAYHAPDVAEALMQHKEGAT